MTSVEKIKTVISDLGGPALGCQYVFTIVPPLIMFNLDDVVDNIKALDTGALIQSGLQGYLLSKTRDISLLAESVSIPGRQLMTTEHRIFGTVRKMPYGVLYDDLTVTFICTNSMMERTFFDIWQQLIISPGSQYMEFYENYVGTIVIQKISNKVARTTKEVTDKEGNKSTVIDKIDEVGLHENLSTYVVMEAYPISIQAQELNYADGEYLKLTVQFAYAKWKSVLDLAMPNNPKLTIQS